MSILTSSKFMQLLNANLDKVASDRSEFNDLNSMINKLANVQSISSNDWQHLSISGVPDIVPHNGSLSTGDLFPGFSTRIEPAEFSLEMQTQRKIMDDKKFDVLNDIESGLMDSAFRVAEKKFVKIFANSTSAAFDFMTSEEGVSLSNAAHKTKVPGVSTASGFSNVGSSAMSASALSATRILMKRFKQDNGERFESNDQWGLVYPDSLDDTVRTIVGTPAGLDGAGDLNINPQSGRYTLFPYSRLDDVSTTTWHMVNISAMKRHLLFLWRIRPETRRTVDWNTFALLQSIYCRLGTGFSSWRWIYSHVV